MPERKQKIIELALEYVQKNGFVSFSYQHIASELGITKASVHHHFPKKEDLGLALLEQIDQIVSGMLSEIVKSDTSYQQRIEALFDIGRRAASGNESICPISVLQAEANMIPPSMKQKLDVITHKEIEIIAGFLQQGREAEVFFFEGDAMAQALMVISALKGALQYARVNGAEYYEQVVKQIHFQLVPTRKETTE